MSLRNHTATKPPKDANNNIIIIAGPKFKFKIIVKSVTPMPTNHHSTDRLHNFYHHLYKKLLILKLSLKNPPQDDKTNKEVIKSLLLISILPITPKAVIITDIK